MYQSDTEPFPSLGVDLCGGGENMAKRAAGDVLAPTAREPTIGGTQPMKSTIVFATVFTAAMAAGAAAQYGDQKDRSGTDRDRKVKETTVQGCLMSGDLSGTGGTTGTTGSASTAAQFYLANPSFTGGTSSGYGSTSTGTSTTTGSTAGSTTGSTAGTTGNPTSTTAPGTESNRQNGIRLVGGDQSKLQKYVNHRVEIKGRFEDNAGSGSAGSATSSTAGSTAGSTGSAAYGGSTTASADQMAARTLRISSVKEISSTCSSSQR